jgi:hypothetical protein
MVGPTTREGQSRGTGPEGQIVASGPAGQPASGRGPQGLTRGVTSEGQSRGTGPEGVPAAGTQWPAR